VRRLTVVLPLVLALALVFYRGHLIPSIHLAPHTYTASEAAGKIGQYATVHGKVAEVSISQGGTIFLDFGANYPAQNFTAVIPSREVSRMIALDGYKGKSVAVTGRLDLYRGKPEIVVHSANQLKILN
jgi:DNA/RNA endonuclease YhcR with UshA esterase domain